MSSSERQHALLNGAKCFLGVLVGGLLGGLLSLAWDFPRSLDNATPLIVFGMGLTYVVFGAVPALLFGIPAIRFLRRKGYSRWPATSILAIGGVAVGVALTAVTFTGFEKYGGTAGASIGFMLGVFLFHTPRAVPAP